jgi:hypothetical protein
MRCGLCWFARAEDHLSLRPACHRIKNIPQNFDKIATRLALRKSHAGLFRLANTPLCRETMQSAPNGST